VYPSLDLSDSEDTSKSKTRVKNDDAWNPKGNSVHQFEILNTTVVNVDCVINTTVIHLDCVLYQIELGICKGI